MKFKPTKLKLIISIIIALIIGVWMFSRIPCFDCSSEIAGRLAITNLLIGLIGSFIPIYFIWSLFQGKKYNIFVYIGLIFLILILDFIIIFLITGLEKFL